MESPDPKPFDEVLAGTLLDELLASTLPGLSRRRARLLIELGAVLVDGVRVHTNDAPPAGARIEVLLGGALERVAAAAEHGRPARAVAAWRVLYEDDDVVVVDKPSGLATEYGPSSLARVLAARSGGRVWVVQRLDTPTSGVLVFARNEAANRSLARKLQRHDVERAYLAVVRGVFPEGTTTLDEPLRGRRATTHVGVVRRFGAFATLVRCALETGRTHQIRLHTSRAGHPVLGDPRHGQRTAWDPPRLALHATRLVVEHPRTGESLVFDSPLPDELAAWLDELAAMVRELEG